MSGGSTSNFLRLLNEANERIAAREAEEEVRRTSAGLDPVRLQKDAERRERLGTLRAREHMSKRPVHARHVFGRSDLAP